MARNLLTDRRIRNAKPRAGRYRLFDGDGLALLVLPSGVKSWQYRYKLQGKAQIATLGKLDWLSLADARAEADKARKLAAQGENLTIAKRTERIKRHADTNATFGRFAQAWAMREARRMKWSPDYLVEVMASLKNHLGSLDSLPLTKITAQLAAPALLEVERTRAAHGGEGAPAPARDPRRRGRGGHHPRQPASRHAAAPEN